MILLASLVRAKRPAGFYGSQMMEGVHPKSFRIFEPERYRGDLQQEDYDEEDESKTTGWIDGGISGWINGWMDE